MPNVTIYFILFIHSSAIGLCPVPNKHYSDNNNNNKIYNNNNNNNKPYLYWRRLVVQTVKRSPRTVGIPSSRLIHTPSCGFCGERNGNWVGISRGFSRFPCQKLHASISPHSSRSFRFISCHPPPVMMHQPSSAGILVIHRPSIKGLHRISSLDPACVGHEFEDLYWQS